MADEEQNDMWSGSSQEEDIQAFTEPRIPGLIGDEEDAEPQQEEEQKDPPQHFEDVPETENLRDEDYPDPNKDTVNDSALQNNSRYWQTQDLVFAGRLQSTYEFLPGRTVHIHTPDQGEMIWIGKRLDKEFGRLDPRIGISTSYDDGIKLITLSVVVDSIDGSPIYTPTSDFEDPMNPELSYADRELAVEKKSIAVRRQWQYWYPWVISRMYDHYRDILRDQEEAMKLLPFYSAAGERLLDSEPLNVEEYSPSPE